MELNIWHERAPLIIDPIERPLAVARMTLAKGAIFQFQIPLRTCPPAFIPPISRRHIRPFRRANTSFHFDAPETGRAIFCEQHRDWQRSPKAAHGGTGQVWYLVFLLRSSPGNSFLPERVGPMRFFDDGSTDAISTQQTGKPGQRFGQ